MVKGGLCLALIVHEVGYSAVSGKHLVAVGALSFTMLGERVAYLNILIMFVFLN